MPYSSIVFNEGEPLDPNKLNQLQTNLADIYKTSNSLYNATVNDQGSATVPVIHFGKIDSPKLVANVTTQMVLPIPSAFNPDSDIYVIASVAQSVGGKIISVYARKDVGRCLAFIISNKDQDPVSISYLMVQQKSV